MHTCDSDAAVLLHAPLSPCNLPLPRGLQSGHWDSEGQQRLVSLTAQVTAQAAQLAAAEQRVRDVLVSGETLKPHTGSKPYHCLHNQQG